MARPTSSDHQDFELARVQQRTPGEAQHRHSMQAAGPRASTKSSMVPPVEDPDVAARRSALRGECGAADVARIAWRRLAVAVGVTAVAALAGWGIVDALTPTWLRPTGLTYGVAGLREELIRHPVLWSGRTVQVHALFDYCIPGIDPPATHCMPWQPALFDDDGPLSTAPLPVVVQPEEDLMDGMHRLPLIGKMLPASRSAEAGKPEIFRVRLIAVPDTTMPYRLVLLTAVPALPPAEPDGNGAHHAAHARPL